MHSAAQAPIGVFDSGVGGLSVLQVLRRRLRHERYVYLADSAFAPYGERGDAFVLARSRAIVHYLVHTYGVKALVVACNTATAAAIDALRAQWPALPLVGVEPALKPAVTLSQTRRVGVLATRGTLASARFKALQQRVQGDAQISTVAADGLAEAIEHSLQTQDQAQANAHIAALCQRYTRALGPWGLRAGMTDTLVLGCTHYVFALSLLRQAVGAQVQVLETGEPVAQHTHRLLARHGLLAPAHGAGALQLLTTGQPSWLDRASAQWLEPAASGAQQVEIAPMHARLCSDWAATSPPT